MANVVGVVLWTQKGQLKGCWLGVGWVGRRDMRISPVKERTLIGGCKPGSSGQDGKVEDSLGLRLQMGRNDEATCGGRAMML